MPQNETCEIGMLRTTLRFQRDRDRGRRAAAGASGEAPVGTYLDMLRLSTATIADDVVLEESRGGGFVLHQVVDCRAHRIGAFHAASDAWVAIDELDDIRAGRL